jgi:hypothetical protein
MVPEADSGELIPEVSVTQRTQVGFDYCKTCGAGYAVTPTAKGRCHDCQRWKEFLRPLSECLLRIEALLRQGKG